MPPRRGVLGPSLAQLDPRIRLPGSVPSRVRTGRDLAPSLMGDPIALAEAPDPSQLDRAPSPVFPEELSTLQKIFRGVGTRLSPSAGVLPGMFQEAAGREGLLAAGASLLESSGRRPNSQRVSTSAALGRAINAGREGASRGIAGKEAGVQLGRQQQGQQAMIQAISEGNFPAAFAAAVAGGDLAAANSLTAFAGATKDTRANPKLQNIDLNDRVLLTDPGTGEIVQTFMKGQDDSDQGRAESTMFNQFMQAAREPALLANRWRAIQAVRDDQTPAGDVSLIFAFMKMIDPGSVVRESEFATAANTGSVPQRVWAMYNRAIRGERLDENVRLDFIRQAANLARSSRDGFQEIRTQFMDRAGRNKLDPEDVVIDFWAGADIPDPAGDRVSLTGAGVSPPTGAGPGRTDLFDDVR